MKRLLFLHIILLFSVLAWAQSGSTVATGLPYECSFEPTEDLSAWQLNYGTPSAEDKWIFGTAVHSEGKRSMYISSDGTDPVYGKRDVVIAMLRYKFPVSSSNQKYDISFDWKGMGDSAISQLCLLICREDELNAPDGLNLNQLVSSRNGGVPNQIINDYGQMLGDRSDPRYFLYGSETWQNISIMPDANGNGGFGVKKNTQQSFYFIFVWTNSNTKDSTGLSSLAIDNFQINSDAVKKPKNVSVYPQCEDSSLLITWETTGAANSFDVQYRKTGETVWAHGVSGISEGTEGYTRTDGNKHAYVLKPILEGSYDVRIRSAYYDDQTSQVLRSNYVYESGIFVYCPDNHCINYVNLYGDNVTCYYGENPNASSGHTPYDNIGVIDYGPDAIESRHTLHIDPTEYDPRTDSLLKTVPDGALASVRLGNWNWGGEAEAIEYKVIVDTTTQGILITKYAIVFENPEGHDEEGQPVFKLEILDKNDQLIDEICGQAKFIFDDTGGAGWHMTRDNSAAWKEWTTVGLNLMNYHNDTIKVRFTVMDCGWSGHYAYAYFTVDCANAHIETENCGSESQVTCVAPDGFAYYWYKDDDPNNPADKPYDQTLVVDATRTKYTCRVSFKEQPDCWFEISTTSEPRFPVPSYRVDSIFAGCESVLKFTNTSHVMNKWDGSEHHTSEPCKESKWTFRRLSDGQSRTTSHWSPTYTCPRTGDSIEVTLTSYIGADNSCEETLVDTIVMPNILARDSAIHLMRCYEERRVVFDRKEFESDTTYTAKFSNFAGCDSMVTLYLKVFPKPQDSYRSDSICSDQPYYINGVRYSQSVVNQPIYLKTANDCDSVMYLTLTVNQRIEAHITEPEYSCADDELFYFTLNINKGVYDSLKIKFSSPALRDTVLYDNVNAVGIPYPANILPGTYKATMTFYQFCCDSTVEEHTINIRYAGSIVEQKWNDVLTLLSPKYNGGYEFVAFQWYKDDMPIAGANHSYLYQDLDFESQYYVVVTRPDGTTMATCPIQPVYHPQQTEYPTIVPAGSHVPMYMEQQATIWYYTVSGQLYGTYTLPQGYTALTTPAQQGIYILKSTTQDGETTSQVMIVQ